MSKYVCYTASGSATGEILAPRFDPDGSIREGIIVWIDSVGKAHQETANSFCPIPRDWKTQWVRENIQNVPHGANLYLVPEEFGLSGQDIATEINAAHTWRKKLMDEARDDFGGGGETTVVEETDSSETNTEFNPADANQDGVVTKKEQKQYDREHSEGN